MRQQSAYMGTAGAAVRIWQERLVVVIATGCYRDRLLNACVFTSNVNGYMLLCIHVVMSTDC